MCVYVCVCVCRILGGRALGLGFSRPNVIMSLLSEAKLREMYNERNSQHFVSGHVAECPFSVDKSGRCSAEFDGIRVEKLHPRGLSCGAKNTALQKHTFVFRSLVNICGRQITVEVLVTFISTL